MFLSWRVLGRMIYLDNHASATMHPTAVEATVAAMVRHVANPHSADHAAGWAAAEAIEAARAQVASALGADADEVVFTSGATEADNLALLGAGTTGNRRRVVVSAIEHKAVLGPARELSRRGVELSISPVTRDGVVDLDRLAALVGDDVALVSVMLVNNEIGTVQPIGEVAAMCARVGAILHVDAAQALGWMPIDAYALGADLVSVSAHKMGGPKGVGALLVGREVRQRLSPTMFGGEQEDGLRPGTLATPLCVGFGAACEALPTAEEVAAWRERTARLEESLLKASVRAWINGACADRHPGAISLTMPDVDADRLVARLQPDVAVSRGSACTSGIPEPSHVLRALGLNAAECDSTVRIGTGRFTTDAEIDEVIVAFRSAAAEARSLERA